MAIPEITIKRAEFVYNAARLAAIAAGAPIVPVVWAEREYPFQAQFQDVIARQCSDERCTSPEQLHQDWEVAYEKMGWVYGEKHDPVAKTHPDMVAYKDLGRLEQDKDAVFVALCDIARLWIYDLE